MVAIRKAGGDHNDRKDRPDNAMIGWIITVAAFAIGFGLLLLAARPRDAASRAAARQPGQLRHTL
ncbi:MAG: hypothetical protein AAFW98_10275, partial [Pseudomonadota bacterium]